MVSAELEETLPIHVHLTNAMVTQAGWPGVVVCTNSCVEVTKQVKMFLFGDVFHCNLKLIVKCVLYFLGGAKCWCLHTHQVDRSHGCVQAEGKDSL